MTYEEIVVQRGLSQDKNMWGQQCRSDLQVNHKLTCRRLPLSVVVTAIRLANGKSGCNWQLNNLRLIKQMIIGELWDDTVSRYAFG